MAKDKIKETKSEYYARTTKSYKLQFRNVADAEIIEKLNSVPSKVVYVRELIRKDIEKNENK